MLKKGEMTKEEFEKLKPQGHKTPFAFFLPKVHKDKPFLNLKMRPIVSSIEAFNYNLAKYLCKKLQNWLKLNGKVQLDSFKFAEQIGNIKNSQNLEMLGLDIENLYPSIPLEEAIELISPIIKQNIFPNANIESIKKLVGFCTKDIFFQSKIL